MIHRYLSCLYFYIIGIQQGKADQFYHRYAYDADNRITEVHTSADGVLWDQDARYFYYDHGPLARTEIGELSVQGMDYAYTLQGWIKGINSNTLQASRDMGKDSQVGLNAVFAPDEFAYSLGYYDQDYKAINSIGGTHFLAGTDQSGFTGSGASLYNGNISHMVTAIGMLMANGPQAYAYSYDQLNRLRTVTAHADPNVMVVNNWASGSAIQDYSEDYQYDLNGNILRVKRNAAGAESNSAGTGMDDLEYVYETIANEYKRETNKLRRVIDHQTGSSLSEDFKPGQSPDNYDYDEIGNLIADEQEKIASIEWTVGGKIRKVVRKQEAGVGKPDLEFAYDASGNRIMKLEKPRVDGDLLPEHAWTYTYYVRDASGNVMRAYTKKYTEETSGYSVTYKATEAPVYGSSRLGLQTLRAGEALAFRPFTATLSGGVFSGISYTADPTIEPASLSHAYSLRGVKQYELNDHLGNVKVVVSDKRNLTGEADVKSYSDYYAFGMQMPGRYANDGYRFGFNGKENDKELDDWQDYGFRMYMRKLGRFLSVDPLTTAYPELTPYQFASNTPIMAIDLDGLESKPVFEKQIDENGKLTIKLVDNERVIDQAQSSTADVTIPPNVAQRNESIKRNNELKAKIANNTIRAIKLGDNLTPFEKAGVSGVEIGVKAIAATYSGPAGFLGRSSTYVLPMARNFAEQSLTKPLDKVDFADVAIKGIRWPSSDPNSTTSPIGIFLESSVDYSLRDGFRVVTMNKSVGEFSVDVLRKASLTKYGRSENPMLQLGIKLSSGMAAGSAKQELKDETTNSDNSTSY